MAKDTILTKKLIQLKVNGKGDKMKGEIVIYAEKLFNGREFLKDTYIVLKENKIEAITKKPIPYTYKGIVTPAFIDAHSHIGMARYSEPESEEEANDMTAQILPTNNPLNSIYFDDKAFEEATDFGILYSCVVPGSGNLLGGKAIIIKNFEPDREKAFLKHYGYKMALGYNPRSTLEWKGERPNTRMGIYSLLEKRFEEVLLKREREKLKLEKAKLELERKLREEEIDKRDFEKEVGFIEREYELEFEEEDKALLEILDGKKTVKVHVHKADDVLYLINLVKKYHLKVTADHLSDIKSTEIFKKLKEHDIPVVYGPLGAFPYKVELKNESYKNTKKLMDSGVFYGLMTDHPAILSPQLRFELAYFLIQGMSSEDALSIITYKNAKILEIDNILGTIEEGKLASLIIWNDDPLKLSSYPTVIIGEGKIIRG